MTAAPLELRRREPLPPTASEELRNALQILRTSEMAHLPGHAVVCDAIDNRITSALRLAEDAEAQVTILKEMVKAGTAVEHSLQRDLRRAQQKIAHLAKELVRAQESARSTDV